MMMKWRDAVKVEKVIKSCNSWDQLATAEMMLLNWSRRYKASTLYFDRILDYKRQWFTMKQNLHTQIQLDQLTQVFKKSAGK